MRSHLSLRLSNRPQALQFFWLVYAALQENRIKLGKDQKTYVHCAKLLVQLEQCIVYGPGAARLTSTSDLMKECVNVTEQATAEIPGEQVVFKGTLRKQGGGTSRCGRKTWNNRHFEIRDRILYYYASEADVPMDRPRGSMQLATATVKADFPKRPNYFEVKCKQSGLKFCLEAPNSKDFGEWIITIRVRHAY